MNRVNPFQFLIDTYETERLKTLSVWTLFDEQDLRIRPNPNDHRGRNALEQMVHQCVSENLWFKNMFALDVKAPPLPVQETREAFIKQYAKDSAARLSALQTLDEVWWTASVNFFGETRLRSWVFLRRLTHSAHHRGQLTYLLRMLGKTLYSTYGPTADTGGLMHDQAPTVYAYNDEPQLLEDLTQGVQRNPWPKTLGHSVTERPDHE